MTHHLGKLLIDTGEYDKALTLLFFTIPGHLTIHGTAVPPSGRASMYPYPVSGRSGTMPNVTSLPPAAASAPAATAA